MMQRVLPLIQPLHLELTPGMPHIPLGFVFLGKEEPNWPRQHRVQIDVERHTRGGTLTLFRGLVAPLLGRCAMYRQQTIACTAI